MKREKMIQLIGDRLVNEIVDLAKKKNIDMQSLMYSFESVIDVKIVSSEIAGDEVALQKDNEMNMDDVKADVVKYVGNKLREEYERPYFLS